MYFLHAINSDRQTRFLNVLGQIAMILGDKNNIQRRWGAGGVGRRGAELKSWRPRPRRPTPFLIFPQFLHSFARSPPRIRIRSLLV